jgi:cation diffusion facilitator CzcD-associated flavoprotein CzcO
MAHRQALSNSIPTVDVAVVGAGMAGLYALYKFRESGLSVQGLEAGSDVGGVWYHNGYPGARVDTDSASYSYFFSPELYEEWQWSERLAGQPEMLRYFNHVADRFALRDLIRFDSRVISAQWHPEMSRYVITTSDGFSMASTYLVMATGQLSEPRKPGFEGLDDFAGKWLQTSRWPANPPSFEGHRVGVIGTGSSGSQVIPPLAEVADHLYVFQRTANYGIPAQNDGGDVALRQRITGRVREAYDELINSPSGIFRDPATGRAEDYTPAEQRRLCEERWSRGAQNMNHVFSDQSTNIKANDIVAEFVRHKVRSTVKDPDTVSKLLPREYPIGTRRLAVSKNYYETFNRENVSLVDVKAEPITRFTPTGIQTTHSHVELDIVVFSIGFEAFNGPLVEAGIRNEHGHAPTDRWARGPQTYLGLMTSGFPNLFFVSGAGSPSVLANFFVLSEYQINLIAEIIEHAQGQNATIEVTPEAESAWSSHVDDLAKPFLRRAYPNYMVHINTDGSRAFVPYPAGLGRYHREVRDAIEDDFRGFVFELHTADHVRDLSMSAAPGR